MKQRVVYIDVFRGSVMLIVVYSHLLIFSVGYKETSNLTNFFRDFYLMSFFFISGFVGNKIVNWNGEYTISYIGKKIKSLLIPSLFSLGLFCYMLDYNYLEALTNESKIGYWFTIVLFEMFLIYAIFQFLTDKIKKNNIKTLLVIFLALIFYVLHKFCDTTDVLSKTLCLGNLLLYLPSFFLGIICHMNIEKFHQLINNKYLPILIVLVILISLRFKIIPYFVMCILITLLMFMQIKKIVSASKGSLMKQKCISLLQAIGQNTIQIYFLHYYLLFRLPDSIVNYMHGLYYDKCFLIHSSVGFIEFIIIGILSIFISYSCIIIAKFLNSIPYFSRFMFGK